MKRKMKYSLNIFGPSATTIGCFWVSLNYPILNFKIMICLKKVWMQHGEGDANFSILIGKMLESHII